MNSPKNTKHWVKPGRYYSACGKVVTSKKSRTHDRTECNCPDCLEVLAGWDRANERKAAAAEAAREWEQGDGNAH